MSGDRALQSEPQKRGRQHDVGVEASTGVITSGPQCDMAGVRYVVAALQMHKATQARMPPLQQGRGQLGPGPQHRRRGGMTQLRGE
jgi:hypothetical protein